MSHPPKTSRELVEILSRLSPVNPGLKWLDDAKVLIEAWVLVREAQAKRDQHQSEHSCENTTRGAWDGYNCKILAGLESAIEQLKGAAHDQAEAPSAAASANSEPGGA